MKMTELLGIKYPIKMVVEYKRCQMPEGILDHSGGS